MACHPKQVHVIAIECSADDLDSFRQWRRSLHNVVAYRRNQCRWWHGVGIWGWWNGKDVCGIVGSGPVSITEFKQVVQKHGAVTLKPIAEDELRAEVYRAALAVDEELSDRRYQSSKIAITPIRRPNVGEITKSPVDLPMPILL